MTYGALAGELDAWFGRGVASTEPGVVLCRRGCAACCHGPFDISPSDAELVANAIDRLEPSDRLLVQLRAAHQVSQYAEYAPQWIAPWDVDSLGDDQFDRVSDALAQLPCPALGADRNCLIYADRPANCRIIGLAMLTPDGAVLDNACPILHTSERYATLDPTLFDLPAFEDAADEHDDAARARGWVSSTVAGAIATGRN